LYCCTLTCALTCVPTEKSVIIGSPADGMLETG
jgi:hypothetical protein